MKTMKIIRKFIAFTAIFIGMTGWAGDSAAFLLDTIIDEALIEKDEGVSVRYNSSWVGGDSSAEVVISVDGTEIKRTTGEGEFIWEAAPGKHTFTYTTYIDGVAQEEVYTATVFKDWKYTVEDGKAIIIETTKTLGDVTIPSEIDGYPVVAIGDGLFKGCEGLTGVVIPDGVTRIGAGVFNGCSGIRSVSISPTCKIDDFKSGLYQVKFNSSDDFISSILDSESKSLVSGVLMGDAYDTESITRTYTDPMYGGSYKWNSRNTTFGYAGYMYMIEGRTYVFGKYFDDSVLVRINGNEVLKNTDYTAFATGKYTPEKTGWHEIEVRVADGTGDKGPKGVSNSGYWSGNLGVGWRDDGITNALPESVWNKMMDPGDGSLFRCLVGFKNLSMSDLFPDSYDKLTSVTLIGDAAVIPNNAFAGCAALESFIIPDSVTKIGANAFDGCSSLTEIVIPDSVYSIGTNAFANCTGLAKVSMPSLLKEQVEAEDIFIGCSENLGIVYRSAEITDIVAKQRFPWNGKVDITYNVTGNIAAGLPEWLTPVISVSALDRSTGLNYEAQVLALSGDTGIEEGEHHVVWDLNAQNLQVKSDDMVFTVAYLYYSRYCIIDLSSGVNATSYPVSYLEDVPRGGWTDEYKTTKLVLRLIKPGSFKMDGSYDVTLTKPYYMGVFEVTQKQYELVTGNKPSNFTGDTLPVELVSWDMIRGDSSTHNWPTVKTVDSNSFIGRIQVRTGLNFDLPTEAQWEYACRAGTTTTYYWGDSMDGAYGWYYDNPNSKTHEVGTKTPNAWGLYDMSGNVWEWCLDWKGSLSSCLDPEGASSGANRVKRGGSWFNNASLAGSSYRSSSTPSNRHPSNGFRLSRTLANMNSERSTEVAAGAERAVKILYFASGESAKIDSRIEPLVDSIEISYNSSWIGGESSAEVVIAADGTEIKRTTGEGEFAWAPTTPGKHTLTYTIYIDGVAQEEVYIATVFKDWKYTVEDGKATIVETTQTSGDIIIPSEIDGYPVVGLGDALFDGCEGLTGVVIPDSVTYIGAGVFNGCSGIRSVSISPTCKIDDFKSGLYQVKFNSSDDFTSSILDSESKSLVSGVLMGDAYDTESITRTYTDPKYGGSYKWNSKYTTFGYAGYMYMVEGRTYVFGKYFDDSVLVRINGVEVLKSTEHTAFATGKYIPGKTGWHEIEVRVADGTGDKGPKGVSNSGYWSGNLGVGWRDDGITDALPESGWNKMMDPGDGSLFRCLDEVQDLTMRGLFPDSYDKLTSVTLTRDGAVIPNNAFAGCVALESFTIPDSVTTIGANAFDGCSLLTEIVIPDSVYSIGANAFANCTNLTNVSIPLPFKGLVEARDIFVGCSEDLEIVYRSAEITDVVAKQRFPWNGKVDIKFEVIGNVNAGFSSENSVELTMTAKDSVTGKEWIAKTLTGDTGTNEGEHHVVWDMKADGLSFYSQNIKFKVAYSIKQQKQQKYCLIDLSAGKDATNYPVSYHDDVPEGGWTDEYKTTKLVLRLIEPGSFKMGGTYDVTLTKPYYIGVFEVTQKQYELVTGSKPSNWSGDTLPVEQVTWNMIRGNSSTHNWPTVKTVDSNSFVGRLQARTGLYFDLPTEAQWEYACRAGTTTTYYWGDSMDGAYAWYYDNSISTHTVGTKTPNAWGLYDMSGNVWEWCLDWKGSILSGSDTEGSSSGSQRVLRGGSWRSYTSSLVSSDRGNNTPSYISDEFGFRVVRTLSNINSEYSTEAVAGAERAGEILYFGTGESIKIDSRIEPLVDSIYVSYDSAWIGGDSSAEVVIEVNGTEIKRTTGDGEFAWVPTMPGKHTLIYTTYIDGVAQEEVYTATVFKDWKYTLEDGKATIIETTQTSGDVVIPSEIDGYLVVGLDGELFKDCEGLTSVTIPERFEGVVDYEGVTVIYNDYGFSLGGDANWVNDALDAPNSSNGSLRSGKIDINEISWMEMTTPGPGRLTYRWKASSEYYEDQSLGIYRIYDYGYLAVDDDPKGFLDENYMTNGIAIGGHTSWQDVELDISGEGAHKIRWVFAKDEYDDPETIGEDCIWVDDIKFRPLVTLSFNLGGGVGDDPVALTGLFESFVTLPSSDGFEREDYIFEGWYDGNNLYESGERYEIPKTNVVLTAQWIAKRFHTFNLNGGVGEAPVVIKDIPGTTITLPDSSAFDRDYYTFVGWSDGVRTYSANASYTVGDEGVEFIAVWNPNTISAPVIVSSSVANGGILDAPSATISMSCENDANIYYTLDGSTPTAESIKYTGSFEAFALGNVTIKAIAVRDNYFDSEITTFTYTRKAYTLAESINASGMNVTSTSASPWFIVFDDESYDGSEAIRSGSIGAGETSTVEMTVEGNGAISFWWKVSSHEDTRGGKFDYVAFFVDDVEVAWISGEKDWANVTYTVGAGSHTLKWVYKKNGDAYAAGEDCAWLDEVAFEKTLVAIDEPVAVENLVYNGFEQMGVIEAEGYTLSGVSAATDAGEYTATATLADGYKWADGSMDDKVVTWSIAKAANEWITEPKISLESWTEGETVGELTDGVAKFGEVIATINGAAFTALPTEPGSYTIEYSVAETGNFSGLTKSVTFGIIKYVPIIISEITYENLHGATHANPETYQEGTVVEFTNPSEVEGYTFAGWTPERISADMTGAQTVRANWTANNYTIAYNSNGGSGTMEPTLATYDSEAIVKDNEFVRDGYIFKGWALEEGGDVAYAPGQSVMNLTAQLNGVVSFYAVWERILIAVDEPVAAENLIYNGTEQVGVAATDGYTLSGVIAAVDAGEYTAIATLADGYKWADGSMDDKTITWSIAKATNEWITEPKISLESWTEGDVAGELTDGVAKFGAVVVTMGGAEFTALPTEPGSYTIEYTVAETSSYTGLDKSNGLNRLVTFEILEMPNPVPAINPDWGYVVTELGEKKNEVAVVFTNHTETAMTWTVPVNLENVRFLVVGGGGGGGSAGTGGGGGAGGGGVVTGMIHKLEMDSTISIAVGSGGAGGTRNSAGGLLVSAKGGNSTLTIGSVGAITAYGGARVLKDSEYSGGSGNGSYGIGKAGTAIKGKVDLSVEELVYSVESFGNNGGYGYDNKIGGGGGGAYPGDEGKGGNATKSAAGKGGAGLVSDITGESITYGSGGGGSTSTVGASGGEGAGNGCSNKSAKANQGGGGGGAGKYSSGGKGGSGIVVIRYTIPSYLLPEDAEVFPEVTDDSKVPAALEGSADAKLAENITDAATYMAFREWALNLEGITPEEVKASPNAWLSYALNTAVLIIDAPKEGDVIINVFESAVTEGAFEFTVKIDGITVGDNALGANLRKVFDIEGAETLANGGAGFSTDNVEVNTATPENGNVKFTVTPKTENGEKPDSFFFRVKMK